MKKANGNFSIPIEESPPKIRAQRNTKIFLKKLQEATRILNINI